MTELGNYTEVMSVIYNTCTTSSIVKIIYLANLWVIYPTLHEVFIINELNSAVPVSAEKTECEIWCLCYIIAFWVEEVRSWHNGEFQSNLASIQITSKSFDDESIISYESQHLFQHLCLCYS